MFYYNMKFQYLQYQNHFINSSASTHSSPETGIAGIRIGMTTVLNWGDLKSGMRSKL